MKYEVPDSCKIKIPKKTKIEKLSAKFLLISHPYPSIEGELLIVKPNKKDKDKKEEDIVIRDYSLRRRIPAKEIESVDKEKDKKDKKKKEKEESKLACLEVNIEEPINTIEWQNMSEVLNLSQGLAWFQVLPVGFKSSQPF